jgi:hypothetical protein
MANLKLYDITDVVYKIQGVPALTAVVEAPGAKQAVKLYAAKTYPGGRVHKLSGLSGVDAWEGTVTRGKDVMSMGIMALPHREEDENG